MFERTGRQVVQRRRLWDTPHEFVGECVGGGTLGVGGDANRSEDAPLVGVVVLTRPVPRRATSRSPKPLDLGEGAGRCGAGRWSLRSKNWWIVRLRSCAQPPKRTPKTPKAIRETARLDGVTRWLHSLRGRWRSGLECMVRQRTQTQDKINSSAAVRCGEAAMTRFPPVRCALFFTWLQGDTPTRTAVPYRAVPGHSEFPEGVAGSPERVAAPPDLRAPRSPARRWNHAVSGARPSGAGEEVTDAIPRCFAVGSADQGATPPARPLGPATEISEIQPWRSRLDTKGRRATLSVTFLGVSPWNAESMNGQPRGDEDFVSYSFRDENHWIESHVIPIVRSFGHEAVTARFWKGSRFPRR